MRPRVRRLGVLVCGLSAFVSWGAGSAGAQDDTGDLQAGINQQRQHLGLLEGQRLILGQLVYLEGQLPECASDGAGEPPPGSVSPGAGQRRWMPAAGRRVCPSPLFGELLWSGSTPRCVGKGHTLLPGWRFDNKEPLVCAKCTPNCAFAATTGGRLICAVVEGPKPATGKATGGGPPAPGRPSPAEAADLEARKKALGLELDQIRQAGSWNPDHHRQVGTFISNARTSEQLDHAETLMYDYAECYDISNAARARIFEAAKAGRYPTPGHRIGELNSVHATFTACMDRAISRWKTAMGR